MTFGFWWWARLAVQMPEYYSGFYDEAERRTLRCRWECWQSGIAYAWEGWRREVNRNA